jgi:hypothetical protein
VFSRPLTAGHLKAMEEFCLSETFKLEEWWLGRAVGMKRRGS